MAFSTRFGYDATSTQRKKLWDPSETLGIINMDPGYQRITCIGHAPSQGRRCRNPIRSDNRDFITATLNEIAYLRPDNPTVMSRLRSIAGPALCVRYHQGQAESIVRQWQRKIQQLSPRIDERKPTKPVRDDKNQDSEQTINELREQLREMRELLAQLRDDRDGQGSQSQGYESPNEQASRRRQEAERRRQESEERERERLEKERLERERLERERLERERLEKERLEKERLEKEKREREKEESNRRAREEQAAQNERIRQRAQKRREEREREKREAERREEEEWEQSWIKYQERWAEFRTTPLREGNIRDAIPWPVKSGSYRDVKASNVNDFLKRAVARDASPVKLIRKECKKWHPDSINRLLRDAQLTDADEMMIEMICRVVTDLLNNASGRSSELFD
jgi:hypothetical protein